jgi:hypothetical protein
VRPLDSIFSLFCLILLVAWSIQGHWIRVGLILGLAAAFGLLRGWQAKV